MFSRYSEKLFQFKFFDDLYLAFLFIVSFICWYFSNEILGVACFSVLIWLVALQGRAVYLLPLPLFVVPIFRGLLKDVGKIANASDVITASVIIMVVAGVGGLVFDIIKHKRFKQKGRLFLAFSLIIGAMVLSLFNSPDIVNAVSGMAIYVFMFFFYVYILNIATAENHFRIFLSKTITYFVSLTALMCVMAIVEDKTVTESIIKKDINIGWSISNNIATYLVFGIPFILYLSIHEKYKFAYYFLSIILAVVTFLTGSRAGIGGLVLLAVPSIVYTLYRTERKDFVAHLLTALLFTMPFIFVAIYLNIPEALYQRLFVSKFFFYYDDRKRLLEIAMESFSNHPLIGTGVFSAGHYIKLGGKNVFSYHNIFFETLACMGIAGIMAYVYFSFVKFKMLLFNSNMFKLYGLMAIVGSYIFALVDTSYLNPIYMYMVVAFLAIAEKSATIQKP
jgi:hypothetical protein